MKFSSAHTLRTSNAREGEASNERQQPVASVGFRASQQSVSRPGRALPIRQVVKRTRVSSPIRARHEDRELPANGIAVCAILNRGSQQ